MPRTIEELEEELRTARGQLKNANAKLDQSAEDLAHAVEERDEATKQSGLALDLVKLYEEAEREELEDLVHSVLPKFNCEGKDNSNLRTAVDVQVEAEKQFELKKKEAADKEAAEELAHSKEKSVGKTEPPSTGNGAPTPDHFSSMIDG